MSRSNATEYIVWREADGVTRRDGRPYFADDPRNAAKQAAARDQRRDVGLVEFPANYIVWDTVTRKKYRVGVECAMVPEFWTGEAKVIK